MRLTVTIVALLCIAALPCTAQVFTSTPGTFISNTNITPAVDSIDTTLVGPAPATITTIAAEIDITHTWDGDMDIRLTPPGGAPQFDLSLSHGGSFANYTGTIFTGTLDICRIAANGPIALGAAPFTGTWTPDGLAAFDALYGTDANGIWTIEITDNAAGDDGNLNSWSLNFNCPPPPTHQVNTPTASLSFTGTECTVGAVPSVRSLAPGDASTMTISSGINGEQAYLLAVTPGFGAAAAGLALPGVGILDFDLLGLGSMTFVIDGIGNSNGLIDLLLGTTTPAATRDLTFSMGSGAGTLGTFQAAVVDPTSGSGLQLTQATQLDYAGVSAFAPASLPVPGVTDDSFTQILFGAFGAFDFYGISYTDVYVNSNGSISFGAGSTSLGESFLGLETGAPRIGVFWDDLNPTTGGSVTYDDTAGMFSVVWHNVPEYFDTGNNNGRVDLLPGGVIQLSYGVVELGDALVGIGPGGASAPTLAADFSNLQLLGSTITGGPLDPIAELFTAGFDLGDSLCGGAVATPLFFVPNAGFAIPGDTGYTAP